MTYHIHPIINLNGESRENHVNARMDARYALQEAMKCLSALRPHGRDYPGRDNADRFSFDLSEYNRRFAALDEIANVLLDEALTLHREGDTA